MFSICMMLKNEDKFLDLCLRSLNLYTDKILAIDTGSTDSTKDILRKHNVEMYDYEFTTYSEIRNNFFGLTKSRYLLILDGDETIVDKTIDIRKNNKKGYTFHRCHYLGNGGIYFDQTTRLYENNPNIRYKGEIFEYIELNNNDKELLSNTIHHFGYLKKNDFLLHKFNKYIQNAEKEVCNNKRPELYSIMALYNLFLNKIDKAFECCSVGESILTIPWFFIIKSDIFKINNNFSRAEEVLMEGKEFCLKKMDTSPGYYNFFLNKIINKLAINCILQKEYDHAIELLGCIDMNSPLYYAALTNMLYIYSLGQQRTYCDQIQNELSKYPFEYMRIDKKNNIFNCIISDTLIKSD